MSRTRIFSSLNAKPYCNWRQDQSDSCSDKGLQVFLLQLCLNLQLIKFITSPADKNHHKNLHQKGSVWKTTTCQNKFRDTQNYCLGLVFNASVISEVGLCGGAPTPPPRQLARCSVVLNELIFLLATWICHLTSWILNALWLKRLLWCLWYKHTLCVWMKTHS